MLALGTGATVIAMAIPAAAATAATAALEALLAGLFATRVAAALGGEITGLAFPWAAVFTATLVIATLIAAASATAAMPAATAALVARLAVAALEVTFAGLGLGGTGAAEETLEPGEEAAGFLDRGRGGRRLAETTLGCGFAAGFTRLEGPRVAALGPEGAAILAAAAGIAVGLSGVLAPADGRAFHVLRGEY